MQRLECRSSNEFLPIAQERILNIVTLICRKFSINKVYFLKKIEFSYEVRWETPTHFNFYMIVIQF